MRDRHMRAGFEKSLEGRLSPEEAAPFEAHLAECAECAESYRFAKALRGTLEQSAPGLSNASTGRLRARTGQRTGTIPGRPTLLPVPVLAGAGVFALLLVGMSFLAGLPQYPRRSSPAVPVAAASDPLALKAAEARAASRELGLEASPVVIAEFETVGDMSRVTVAGGRQAGLAYGARSGRAALGLQAAAGPEPVEVRVDLPYWRRCGRTAAISFWAHAAQEPVVLAVRVGTSTGETLEGTPVRRVDRGGWRWVVFALPGMRGGVTHVVVTVHGRSPLGLDRMELWCARGGDGG